MKKIKKLLANKYVSWTWNIGYIIGWIVSIEQGWYGWYFLGTTALMLLLYWKPLYGIMKFGGDMYAAFCKKQSLKLTQKVYPTYKRDERPEEKKKNDIKPI